KILHLEVIDCLTVSYVGCDCVLAKKVWTGCSFVFGRVGNLLKLEDRRNYILPFKPRVRRSTVSQNGKVSRKIVECCGAEAKPAAGVDCKLVRRADIGVFVQSDCDLYFDLWLVGLETSERQLQS